MNKPLLGVILGGVLGAVDGLSALVSSPTPEVKAGILGIVIGSTFKGLIVGLIAGFFARKVRSVPMGLLVGGVAGLIFAALVCLQMQAAGQPPYWLEVMIPGSIVGLIVGYATQKYGKSAAAAMLLMAFLVPSASAGEMSAATAFEQLKGLAGSWKGTIDTPDGAGAEVTFRVTAGGSAVFETQFGGTEYEMVSVYHLDGEDLLMTHYCSGGNQPRMKLDRNASTPEKLRFVFDGGTNLQVEKDAHIHEGSITLSPDGALDAFWQAYTNGKPDHGARFLLKRVR